MADRREEHEAVMLAALQEAAGAGWRTGGVVPARDGADSLATYLARCYAAGEAKGDDESLDRARRAKAHWPLDAMTVRMLLARLVEERGRVRESADCDFGEMAAKLDAFVAGLPAAKDSVLHGLRCGFYEAAKAEPVRDDEWCETCSAPGGSGKTLAVMRRMLRVAHERGLARIIVVVPYISLNEQSHDIYRDVFASKVTQHHHAAPAPDELWDSPIVVTTGASFFAALTNTSREGLRRLANLNNACVFLDDCHGHCEPHLWGFYLPLLRSLTAGRFCHVAFGSASFPAWWKVHKDAMPEPREFVPAELLAGFRAHKDALVQQVRLPKALNADTLMERVMADDGPVLCVLNTRLSAAEFARRLKALHGGTRDVRLVSNGLVQSHRNEVMRHVHDRLNSGDAADLVLVATSVVETGIDISFRRGFREAAGYNSSKQCASRVNRSGEYGTEIPCSLEEFVMSDPDFTDNPRIAAERDAVGRAEKYAEAAGLDVCTLAAKYALEDTPKKGEALHRLNEDERRFRFAAVDKANSPISYQATRLVRIGLGDAYDRRRDAGMSVSLSDAQLKKLRDLYDIVEIEGGGHGTARCFAMPAAKYDPFLGVFGFLNDLAKTTA